MSFIIEANNIKYINDVLEHVNTILDNTILKIKDDGLYISDMDASHISFIYLELDQTDFNKYDVTFDDNENCIGIGISLTELVKVIKSGIDLDNMILKYNKTNKLEIIFNGLGFTRKFKLPLINIECNDLEIPSMDYMVELEISYKIFKDIINSLAISETETIIFSVDNHKLKIKADSVDSEAEINFEKKEMYKNKRKLKIKPKDSSITSDIEKELIYKMHSCEDNFSISFNFNRIKQFIKNSNLSDTIMCNLSSNLPIRFDHELNDRGSVIYYYLSPKIEDN